MTELTDSEVRALLDGATPGPWRADGEPWNRIVWSSADNRVCFMAHSSGLNDARDTATSNLVAAAPDLARTVIALHAQLADAEATQAALRAEIDRLTRWRAEEGEKIKRQAKALTDLTKHCQRIEAENAGLARKIGKVQRGDGDHSQIADLEAKVINQRNELANLRARDGRLAELAVERDRLAAANAALEAKVAGLMEALKPFCFFSDEPNTTQEAWEIRYCDRFKDWIDFADIESARAALAPADGLAAVKALRVEARENAMQALASMGQAHEAYEAQLEAEAELAAAQQRERVLREALKRLLPAARHYGGLTDDHAKSIEHAEATIRDSQIVATDPGDGWTWNERLGWIGPDGKPADPRRG